MVARGGSVVAGLPAPARMGVWHKTNLALPLPADPGELAVGPRAAQVGDGPRAGPVSLDRQVVQARPARRGSRPAAGPQEPRGPALGGPLTAAVAARQRAGADGPQEVGLVGQAEPGPDDPPEPEPDGLAELVLGCARELAASVRDRRGLQGSRSAPPPGRDGIVPAGGPASPTLRSTRTSPVPSWIERSAPSCEPCRRRTPRASRNTSSWSRG